VSFRFTPKTVHPVRGRFLLFDYLMPPTFTAIAQGEHVSSLTLMSKGEKSIRVLKLPSMPKGEIVGKSLTSSICLSLMASTTVEMEG
jgi:hypothetical protein